MSEPAKIKEVKTILAKLLATENLTVEFANVETASFDVKNRVLLIPTFKDIDAEVLDLFVGHEVSHALYTPVDGLDAMKDKPKNYFGFMNVVEDARIERKIQSKYPGLKKCFYNSYGKLLKSNFFHTDGQDINKLLFIDRLNLKAKLGTQIDIEFNADEQKFYDRAMTTQTWDEVIALTDELFEYCQQELEEKQKEMPETMQQYMQGSDDNQEQEEQEQRQGNGEGESSDGSQEGQSDDFENADDVEEDRKSPADAGEEETDEEGDVKSKQPSSPRADYDNKASDEDGIAPGAKALTDIASRQMQKKLVENDERKITQYVDIPKTINLKEYIVTSETMNDELRTHWTSISRRDEILSKNLKEFKNKNQKVINYLAKEFEMKKAADKYAKASESKTGVLNTNKLFSYKYNDDIFKKNMIIPNGKDHGMVFFLDWSGSMCDNLKGTMEQLLCLALFCKKCNIPFSAYAFSSEYEKRTMNSRGVRQSENINEINLGAIALLEFFNDKMNTKQFNQAMENCIAISGMFGRYGTSNSAGDFAYWGLPRSYYIGGTPLDHAIVLATKLVPEFQKRTGVQIMNTVFLTDGSSHMVDGVYGVNGFDRDPFRSGNIIFRDKKTGKQISVQRNPDTSYISRLNCTKPLYKLFKTITGSNTCGFFIASNRDFRYAYDQFVVTPGATFDYYDVEAKRKQWMKEKSIVATNSGLDELYILKGGKHLETSDEGLQVEAGASKGALTSAFKKMNKGKLQNRVILSKFIDKIAA